MPDEASPKQEDVPVAEDRAAQFNKSTEKRVSLSADELTDIVLNALEQTLKDRRLPAPVRPNLSRRLRAEAEAGSGTLASLEARFDELSRMVNDRDTEIAELESLLVKARAQARESRLQAAEAEERSLKKYSFWSQQAQRLLDWIVGYSGDRPDRAISKALSVYKRSMEEEAKGHRLAFLDAEDNIVSEIGGFVLQDDPPARAF